MEYKSFLDWHDGLYYRFREYIFKNTKIVLLQYEESIQIVHWTNTCIQYSKLTGEIKNN
jgi:hypothetical protein